MRGLRNLSLIGYAVIRYSVSLVVLVAGWDLATRAFIIPMYILPPPFKVLSTLWQEFSMFAGAARYTTTNTILGAGLGIGFGLLVGILIGYIKALRWLVEPYLMIFQSFPRESLMPLFVVWLGFGAAPKVVNAALLSFFPMAVVTLNGLLDTQKEYIDLMRSWGASRMQEFLYCRLPALIPVLVSAIKLALPMALIGAVLGEFMGGNEGLGFIIIASGSAFRVDRIFGAIIVLAMIGISILAAINSVQFLCLRRYYQE